MADQDQAHRAVLIVDDDDLGQLALAGFLRRWDIDVVTAVSPAEAYAAPPCRVVVSEMRLTGQTAAEGLELLGRLRQQRPESEFVIFSSFVRGLDDERIAGVATTLPKTTPFREAAAAIRALLERPGRPDGPPAHVMKQSFLSRYGADTPGHLGPSAPHIFDSELIGFAAWDDDGRLVAANREFCRMTGVERGALEHGSVQIAELLVGFDLGSASVQEQTLSRGGETRLLRLQADLGMRHAFLVDATGQYAAELALANARRLLESHAAAIIGTDAAELLSAQPLHDAQTKLERQERDIAELLERVAAAHHELESFSYSVSHDLRAPLRAVDGFSAELMERYSPVLDEQGRHYVTRIRAGAQKLGQTIDDLLRLSRVGRAPMRAVPVDLSSIARGIAAEVSAGSTRCVRWIIPEHVQAEGDRELLSLALQNLLHNAWKFTAPCGDAVIELRAEGPPSRRVYSIRDNGVGFDMRYADKLFAPFQRLHPATAFEGTGIGLATVKRIVHRHGGQIWAESTPGGGATFSFTVRPARQDQS